MRDLDKAVFRMARTIARLDVQIAKPDDHGLVYVLVAYGNVAPPEGLIYGKLVGVPKSAGRGKVGFRFQRDVVGLVGAMVMDGGAAHRMAERMDAMYEKIKVMAVHRRDWQRRVRSSLIIAREALLMERERGLRVWKEELTAESAEDAEEEEAAT